MEFIFQVAVCLGAISLIGVIFVNGKRRYITSFLLIVSITLGFIAHQINLSFSYNKHSYSENNDNFYEQIHLFKDRKFDEVPSKENGIIPSGAYILGYANVKNSNGKLKKVRIPQNGTLSVCFTGESRTDGARVVAKTVQSVKIFVESETKIIRIGDASGNSQCIRNRYINDEIYYDDAPPIFIKKGSVISFERIMPVYTYEYHEYAEHLNEAWPKPIIILEPN